VNDFGYRKVTHQGDQGYGGTKSRTICKQKPTDRQLIRKGKNGTKNISNIAIEAPQWRYLILMFVDDFVELNFSDRNFLNLRPNPDTNLAFHGVCPEVLTIPLKTAKNQGRGIAHLRLCLRQSFTHNKRRGTIATAGAQDETIQFNHG
jgi:hypothetical protein